MPAPGEGSPRTGRRCFSGCTPDSPTGAGSRSKWSSGRRGRRPGSRARHSSCPVPPRRSGVAGGAHVNKVESAVRITHEPSGVTVLCQQERSQHKNRAMAMKILRSKVYELEMRQRAEKAAEAHKTKKAIP